ncbi:MAG: DJ-1/PfpI family protein [Opitutales bacterium]|nr:DJ-1/PfpI family protein [Opitutales bacterium]
MKKVIFLMFDNVEELEAIAPIDYLKRANADVCLASLCSDVKVRGRSGIEITCDSLFANEKDKDFDMVVVPGGPGTNAVLKNEAVLEFIDRQYKKGSIIGAICAAPVVLKTAGILDGKKCTAHTSRRSELDNCSYSDAVVVDENVITSQGAGTAIEFALSLVEKLFSREIAKEVAVSTCYMR